MSQRTAKRLRRALASLERAQTMHTPFPIEQSRVMPPDAEPKTPVERLEAFRNKTQGEHWANAEAHRSVLTGIKLCIAVLKRAEEEAASNEAAEQ